MAEVNSPPRAHVSHVVWLFPIISIELSADERALGHVVPVVESFARESVMLPAAKDIIGDGVEIVTGVLVAIIVIVVAGEAVALVAVSGGRVVVAGCRIARSGGSLHPGPGDAAPDGVLPVKLALVAYHLVVKVGVVCGRWWSNNTPSVVGVGQLPGNRRGSLPERCGGCTPVEVGGRVEC